jgi:hypothetical protein
MAKFITRVWLFKTVSAASVVLVWGCARVSVSALNANGTTARDQASGMRYYLPKPYLLVTLLPAEPPKTEASSGSPPSIPPNGPGTGPHHHQGASAMPQPGAAPSTSSPAKSGQEGTGSNQATTPSSASDTAFMASTSRYVVKLIYLPDLQHPMAVTESPGLVGTVTMGASLQDGWMLTSLQGSGDSKVSETISAMASLVSAVYGGGAGKAAAAAAPKPGGAPSETTTSPISQEMLAPGLYSFEYNTDGTLIGLCAVTLFHADGNLAGPCAGSEKGP